MGNARRYIRLNLKSTEDFYLIQLVTQSKIGICFLNNVKEIIQYIKRVENLLIVKGDEV